MKSISHYVVRLGFLASVFGIAFGASQPSVAQGQSLALVWGQLARFSAPSLGPADAKVQIVEFVDPACEGCKAFHPIVKEILAQNPGKVRLIIRHVGLHKGSEYPIKVLEASRKQGKYWEVLDVLFATQSTWSVNHTVQPAKVLAAVSGVGLDMPRLQRDIDGPDIAQLVAQDLADAKTIKVMQTPDFYINGKHLQPFGVEELRKRVRDEVSAAYK